MATSGDIHDFCTDHSGSDIIYDNICQPCRDDGKILEAEGRCKDCEEFLCKTCFQGHTLPRPMRHHVLISKDQLQNTASSERKDRCTQKCSQHDKTIKYYCPTHHYFGCSLCIIQNHKPCNEAIYIPEVAKDILQSEDYDQYNTNKHALKNKIDEITKSFKERIGAIKEDQETGLEKFKAFKLKLLAILDDVEKEFTEESEKVKGDLLAREEGILGISVKLGKKVELLVSDVERFECKRQKCDMYVALVKANYGLKVCEEELRDVCQRGELQRTVYFLPNYSLIDNGVGKIMEEVTQLKYERHISVNTPNDTNCCWISSSVMMPCKKLILADRDNGNLKLVDTQQCKVVDELSLPSKPRDVTRTTSTEVAVTLPAKKQIVFVETENKLMKHREIDVDGECHGIGYIENKLVVSCDNPPKVVMIDLDGVVIHTIASKQRGLLNCPLYVAIDSSDKTIYVSNVVGHNVVCFGTDGTLLSTYTDADLKFPTGITFDSFGMIYVCDWNKGTVNQITKDGRKNRTLLTKADVTNPYTIIFDDFEDRVYVGMRDSDVIKVFRLM